MGRPYHEPAKRAQWQKLRDCLTKPTVPHITGRIVHSNNIFLTIIQLVIAELAVNCSTDIL